jgi:hypothetical protein
LSTTTKLANQTIKRANDCLALRPEAGHRPVEVGAILGYTTVRLSANFFCAFGWAEGPKGFNQV